MNDSRTSTNGYPTTVTVSISFLRQCCTRELSHESLPMADLEEGPLILVKREMTEGSKASRTNESKPPLSPPLAEGQDPPLATPLKRPLSSTKVDQCRKVRPY